MADLSAFIPRSLERLSNDVVVGRLGEPHVAFAVLVYPDREPEIVILAEAGTGASPLRTVVEASEGDDEAPTPGRWFSAADLNDAAHAMQDASLALTVGHHIRRRGPADQRTLGERIAEHIAAQWSSRREFSAAREMEQAAHAEKYSERCPHCGGSFTKKGLPMHLSRSAVCSKREARANAGGPA